MPLDLYGVSAAAGNPLFPFRGADPVDPPPPATSARQLIGMSIPTGGTSFSSPVNQAQEEARIASLVGWPNGGPPMQRLYVQTQAATVAGARADQERIVGDGRMIWVSHKPPNTPAQDISGANDAHWRGWADVYRAMWPTKIWFSYDHENDRHTYSGASNANSAGWVQRQADFVAAFRRIISVMRSRDTTHNMEHVTFLPISTGFGFKPGSNRDPGQQWHPDFMGFGCDPYDFWNNNQGSLDYATRTHFRTTTNPVQATGAYQFYQFCTDPINWYDTYHPTWPIPSVITSNLDKFPIRMGIGETGTQYVMEPNGANTQWVPLESTSDPNAWQPSWIRQMAADLRTHFQRMEVIIYWHSSDGPIGSGTGYPNYFFGPANLRWGAQWQNSIDAFKAEAMKPEHFGPITPWTPGGLA